MEIKPVYTCASPLSFSGRSLGFLESNALSLTFHSGHDDKTESLQVIKKETSDAVVGIKS